MLGSAATLTLASPVLIVFAPTIGFATLALGLGTLAVLCVAPLLRR